MCTTRWQPILTMLLIVLAGTATGARPGPAPAPSLEPAACPALLPPGGQGASSLVANAGYEVGNYSVFGKAYDALPTAYPFGPAGIQDVLQQQASFSSRSDQRAELFFTKLVPALLAACDGGVAELLAGSSSNTSCISSLADLTRLYEALPQRWRPALLNLSTSDAAFARLRLTVNPLLLRAVAPSEPFPIDSSTIVGHKQLTSGQTLAQLATAGRLFVADLAPVQQQLGLEPAPGAYAEFPTALFFLAEPVNATVNGSSGIGSSGGNATTPTKPEARLMPLAIKYNNYSNATISPADPPLDWLLAKAYFNAADNLYHGVLHLAVTHLVLENVCVAAERHLHPTHPMHMLISQPCRDNAGLLADGIAILLPNTTGMFSVVDSFSGPSIVGALPKIISDFVWEGSFHEADLTTRGVAGIPGFAYAEDAGELFLALEQYSSSVLTAYYPDAPSLIVDSQLQAWLSALDPQSAQRTAISGFPATGTVTSAATLGRIAAQVQWLAGVLHHNLNSDKVHLYQNVLPSAPLRLYAAPPQQKGSLTEQQLLDVFLLPPTMPFSEDYVATLTSDTTPPGFLPLMDAPPLQQQVLPQLAGFLIQFGNRIPRLLCFLVNHLYTFSFAILPSADGTIPDTLADGYAAFPPSGCPGSAAGPALTAELERISLRIQAREAGLPADLPRYTLLDPPRLPFYTLI